MATLKKNAFHYRVYGVALAACRYIARRLSTGRRLQTASLLAVCAVPLVGCAERPYDREFTVVAYNVENLFDVDGVAMFVIIRKTRRTIHLRIVARKC